MYRSRSRLRLGMPHTQAGGLSEVALLAHVGDQRWIDFGAASGVPASAHRDAEGHAVYASFYFVELSGFPPEGLGLYGPDDELELVNSLERFGRSMLDGWHSLHRAGTLPAVLPDTLPPAPRVRLSNVLVREGRGTDDLRITAPVNARIDDVPASPSEPDSYRRIREARRLGRFEDEETGRDATPLWEGARTVPYPINPDRDVNGVGLVYFANYVAFMDYAERQALQDAGVYAPEALDGRRTRCRRIGFYGNALRHDVLLVDVEALAAPGDRLLLHHRIRRQRDDRLIAVSSAEKVLRA